MQSIYCFFRILVQICGFGYHNSNQKNKFATETDGSSMDYVDLGKRVRARRMELNWTQEHLAQEIGVSTSFVGHIERGSRKASIDTLVLLANAMEISTDDLLEGSLTVSDELVKPVKRLTKGQQYVMKQVITTLEEHISRWNQDE